MGEIVRSIRAASGVNKIAVQRAYANWSDPRLAMLRGEINELGIEPIQVFGFGRGPAKNAADIQLAIDAVDLAHVRPALEVFVIVSGDGGFSSLAKKLHEYGKTVIGCAYRSAANRTFQAVCDAFVWIPDPEDGDTPAEAVSEAREAGLTDPRNVRLASRIKVAASSDAEAMIAKTREVLNWYSNDQASKADLASSGIFLSVVQEALKFVTQGLDPLRFGFAKLTEYLQFACAKTPLCVVRRPDSQPVLMLRSAVPAGWEVLPDLPKREIHTVEVYRNVLSSGAPIFRLPSSGDVSSIVGWVAANPPERVDLGTIIEGVAAGLGNVSSEAAKQVVLSLVSSNAFEREPDGRPIADQKLTLRRELRSHALLLGLLRNAANAKLTAAFGEVRDEVLDLLLADSA